MNNPLILVTTDFSEQSTRAFAPVVELAKALGGRIHLLHVVPEATVVPHGAPLAPMQAQPDLTEQLREAEAVMPKWAAKFGGQTVETSVIVSSDVPGTVAEKAKELGASYIALSTHGRTGLRRLILGSVAELIVRHAPVPVICYPAGD